MTAEIILTNARVVLADEVVDATLRLNDGVIVSIDPGRTAVAAAEDLGGDLLVPGLVELHTDNMERHITPRPKVRWPMMPALLAHDVEMAAAGITTVFDALRIGDSSESNGQAALLDDAMRCIRAARTDGLLRADHLVHLRCEIGCANAAEMFAGFDGDPLVRLVSLMDHTPGQRQFRDIEKWKIYYRGKYELTEEAIDALIEERRAAQRLHADRNLRAIVGACRERELPMASHDDTTLRHIEEAVELGLTISEFPTTVEAAVAARGSGMTTIAGAPNVVRGGSHSGNVAALELAERGLLDALSSDYVPASLMYSAFLLHHRLHLPLAAAIATVSRNPARMLGLGDRGEIAPGRRADLVQVKWAAGVPIVRRVWREGRRVV